jgi:hypothetical protein
MTISAFMGLPRAIKDIVHISKKGGTRRPDAFIPGLPFERVGTPRSTFSRLSVHQWLIQPSAHLEILVPISVH